MVHAGLLVHLRLSQIECAFKARGKSTRSIRLKTLLNVILLTTDVMVENSKMFGIILKEMASLLMSASHMFQERALYLDAPLSALTNKRNNKSTSVL